MFEHTYYETEPEMMICENADQCMRTTCEHEKRASSCDFQCNTHDGIMESICVPYDEPIQPLTQEVFVGQPPEVKCACTGLTGLVYFAKSIDAYDANGEGSWLCKDGWYEEPNPIMKRYQPITKLDRKFTADGMTWDEAKECARNGELEMLWNTGIWGFHHLAMEFPLTHQTSLITRTTVNAQDKVIANTSL